MKKCNLFGGKNFYCDCKNGYDYDKELNYCKKDKLKNFIHIFNWKNKGTCPNCGKIWYLEDKPIINGMARYIYTK